MLIDFNPIPMVLKSGAEDDIKRSRPILEERREWKHGDDFNGRKDCVRRDEPVFTPVGTIPGKCGRDNIWAKGCGGDEWFSRGIVTRDSKTKQVILRDDKPVEELKK
jgi:hypothetical protein